MVEGKDVIWLDIGPAVTAKLHVIYLCGKMKPPPRALHSDSIGLTSTLTLTNTERRRELNTDASRVRTICIIKIY
jgi:hypothetical protein